MAAVPPLVEVLGESAGIRAVRATVERLLTHGVERRRLPPLLIQGETGTGKGHLARAIHQAGPRSAGPLVEINCAAIPETLLEAELFGFERGAFTDARQAKAGLFQTAHQGTLFLDEVGLLPEGAQSKLLKVLEDQSVRRLGSTRSEPADVSLVAATSQDLLDAVRRRRFREDLYHRLAVVTVRLPSLAERGPDILLLAEHFLARACADYGLRPKALTPDARSALLAYRWPGNVRELANVMERAALLTETPRVTADALGLSATPERGGTAPGSPARTPPLRGAMAKVEPAHLLEALRETDWNVARAAARLQIPRGTLRYRLEKLGLQRGEAPPTRSAPPTITPLPEPVQPVRTGPARGVWPWERRQIAFLRAALVPSSDRDAGPEVARTLQVLVEKAEGFGGRVEALGPLGMVAAFGLEPVEDAPRRAAHAAIAMRKSAERAQLATSAPVGLKIAIHAAQGLVGQVAGGPLIDVAATSQAYAVLEALLTATDRGTILVSAAGARALARRFELVPVGSVEPTGYRLEGLEQPGLAPRGAMTPLVGRESELEQVRRALARTEAGHGQIVAVVGEPGVGKSRLVWEVTHANRTQGWLVLQAGAVSYGTATPYLPVVSLLRTYLQVGDQDEPRTIRESVTKKLLALDRALESALPALLALIDVPVEDRGLETLSPEERRQRTIDALKQLLLRESQVQPLLVVVEDLHWIDAETQAALDRLVESLPAARLLLLVNYRPEYRHDWGGKTYYHQLRLDPLPPEQASALLETLLGGDVGLASFKPLLLARTEGNPFFLEEGVRSLVDDGVLLGDRGAYQLVKAPEAFDVPGTVQAILAARINRLPADDRDLLQIASVVGTDVPGAVLAAVGGRAADALADGLVRLQSAEFLYETSLVPDAVYTFKHALTHEVAYDSLLPERRHALHARILEAIEVLYPDRLAEHVERLAHHAVRGERWEKAVGYLRQAGIKALGRPAYREAAAHLEQALEVLERLSASRERTESMIDLQLQLRGALTPLAEYPRLLDHLRRAQALAEGLGDERRLLRVSIYLSFSLRWVGDLERARELGEWNVGMAEALGDRELQSAATMYLGVIHHGRGEYPRAIELLRWTLDFVKEDPLRHYAGMLGLRSVYSHAWVARSLAELGRFAEAVSHGDEALRIAEAVNKPFDHAAARAGVGWVRLLQGNLHAAIAALEHAHDLSRAWRIPGFPPFLLSDLGAAYSRSGRVDEALAVLEEVLAQARSQGVLVEESRRLAHLGEARLMAGQLDQATAAAHRALEHAREHTERGNEALALHLIGEIAAQHDRPDVTTAEAHYRAAMALASELGMRPLVAHCHLGLGRLAARTGNAGNARQFLTTAATMYREMGMSFWLGKAEAALGLPHGNSP
jgi:DNA-binding NtrC family response regulator/tetratricopeptide (TPR) repeat protein